MRPMSPVSESSRTRAHPWRGRSTTSPRTAYSPSVGCARPVTGAGYGRNGRSGREGRDLGRLDGGPHRRVDDEVQIGQRGGGDFGDEWDVAPDANPNPVTEAFDRVDMSGDDVARTSTRSHPVQG